VLKLSLQLTNHVMLQRLLQIMDHSMIQLSLQLKDHAMPQIHMSYEHFMEIGGNASMRGRIISLEMD
jgi:hypothetical protein